MPDPNRIAVMPSEAAYELDFADWCRRQAALARAGRLAELDAEHIAEELEGLARADRHQIENRLIVLLAHLLKYAYQPDCRSGSWRATIREQRRRIAQLLEASPSLAPHPAAVLDRAYAEAREDAADETGLAIEAFPEACPFALADILDRAWLPGGQ